MTLSSARVAAACCALLLLLLCIEGDALPMRPRARALHIPSDGGGVPSLNLSVYAGGTVMFAVAHPDDVETVAGGTAALLRAQGTTVVYVVTTNGDTGWHKDNTTSQQQVSSIRYSEQVRALALRFTVRHSHAPLAARAALPQLNAAAVFAIPPALVLQFNFADGQLQDASELAVRGRVIAAIRTFRPAAVFTWSPYLDFSAYQWGLEHTDHHTTGQVTLDAVYPSARDFLSWPEQTGVCVVLLLLVVVVVVGGDLSAQRLVSRHGLCLMYSYSSSRSCRLRLCT